MQDKIKRILVINPGSTSTKIGVFDNGRAILEKTIRHDVREMAKFDRIIEQYEFRKNMILETLDLEGINISKFSAICGRGGLLRPIEGGTYEVNEAMVQDLKIGFAGEHASNLGGIIAFEIAEALNIPAFIVDPVVVDEMEPIAKVSGFPGMERKSIFHALNQKAVARRVASRYGRSYHEMNFVVAHMGGGITVGAHKNGKVIDVNNGLHGDGPFSPERAGTVPAGDLVALCYSGEYQQDEMMKRLVGGGGLMGYLGTNDGLQVERMIKDGDEQAALIFKAMAYQVAKEIGAASSVLAGKVDSIILTGGLAYSRLFTQEICERVNWIADCVIEPGENELQALAEGALRVLDGQEKGKSYPNSQELLVVT